MNIFKKSLVAAVATGVILTSTGIGMGVAVATPVQQRASQVRPAAYPTLR